MKQLTATELEISARISLMEHLLVLAFGLRLANQPREEAREFLSQIRAQVLIDFRNMSAPEGANAELHFEIQRRTIAAAERWFDRVEALLPMQK